MSTKSHGQQGYYRAIAGFQNAANRTFHQASEQLPTAARKDLKDSAFQKLIAVPRVSFESMMKKKVAPLINKR